LIHFGLAFGDAKGYFHASFAVQIVCVDVEQRKAEGHCFDIVTVALPGVMNETKTSREGNTVPAHVCSSDYYGRLDQRHIPAVDLTIEVLDRSGGYSEISVRHSSFHAAPTSTVPLPLRVGIVPP
jgi:hypothetical protein